MRSPSLFSTIVLLAAKAAAHGAVTSYVIAGVDYPGYASSYISHILIVW